MKNISQLRVEPARAGRRPHSLARGIADLRRGQAVLLRNADRAALALAAEALDDITAEEMEQLSGSVPFLATTRRRAVALRLTEWNPGARRIVELRVDAEGRDDAPRLTASRIRALADPTIETDASDLTLTIRDAGELSLASGAIHLSRLAHILPAVALFDVNIAAADGIALSEGLIELDCSEITLTQGGLGTGLRRVADADVPLADAETARLIAFRPDDGGIEHIAILIGDPPPGQPLLTRIHSECFTGDLLGSLRCDCGDQLRGAIRLIAEAGGGVLIYLAQEGRGIGLVNKLRAYRLQDSGFDTVDANHQLGFDADERLFQPAAEMLRQLGFDSVRLLTNNPDKVAALRAHGIQVVERVPHSFPSNPHNHAYLQTKATKSGHLF